MGRRGEEGGQKRGEETLNGKNLKHRRWKGIWKSIEWMKMNRYGNQREGKEKMINYSDDKNYQEMNQERSKYMMANEQPLSKKQGENGGWGGGMLLERQRQDQIKEMRGYEDTDEYGEAAEMMKK